ncbi:RNA polymerase II-associated factor 1 homolog isoform X3 [Acyrthosiphon pisum]|uniref:RNA polymerase II-associated factor 1 homolog n=1 Tax=Acyrthosiphon pisum TaxID=7029 RepID=A0A8R2JVL8_ACYPI|nr:RNA polymerase II-associated factor 1 homolog isoform X3 [Acyrthosiphon pisum]|eukprot:XP_016663623.1 PREDICTED: RNA polymerase II-associated factor 1 homolog isoform X3 [Acyrthosiphon pisum]
MAPTVQNNTAQEKRPQRVVEKRSDLVCKVKYCNMLPDIPFDLKFLSYPFDATRYIQYNPTSLERSYKFEILADHDLGLNIDLVNKDKYTIDYNLQMDNADEKLLEEDVLAPQDSKRSRHHARSVSWLRRTEYISTEKTRFQPQTIEKVEAKVGFSIQKNFKEETLYMDRDSQMKAIEKTFEDNKKPVEKHYSKPNVHAVETLNVFPDFKNWRFPCAQVIFDSDPAPMGRPVPAQIEEMSQAMIRGVMDESGEQFVAYFLPSEETIVKRREDAVEARPYDDDYEYEYKMAREYNWNVKSKSSKGYEENYFFIVQSDGVYYNELETRVRLSKRRQKIGTQSSSTNTRLIVRHVPINEQEFSVHKFREKQLQPYDEEEEAKAEEAAKKAMQAAKESAKEIATKNKADSDDDDDNESRKVSDSDVSDDDEERLATSKAKRAISETVDSDKEKNKKRLRAASEVNSDSDTSAKKSNSHKVSSGSDESDKSDEEGITKAKESSQSGDSEEERKVKRVSSEARSDSDNSDVEMRSKKSSERGASEANSDSSITDNSDQESNRGSDSD